ncbi:MAG: hypothetical protein HKN21_05805, partial [Candidatus Eisenbacteria bacterium]|nr:hypothetical protein [Candidatus Eisenbacteria bacterium]
KEEIITDRRMGLIRILTPVKVDGSVDDTRTQSFMGETQLMTQAGPLPVHTEIEANNLEEALAAFPEAIQKAVEKMMTELQEMRRQEASRIVVPGQNPGKIEMP